MNIKIINKNTHLEILISGIYSSDKAIEYFSQILSECRKRENYFVLIDFSKVEEQENFEKFLFAMETQLLYEDYLKSGGKPIKFAYVGRIDQVEGLQPGYNYAKRQKLPALLTEDREEAITWLKK